MKDQFQPIKNLFEDTIGAPVNIIDNLNPENKEIFLFFMERLKASNTFEEECFDNYGMDLTTFTSPLWEVIEGCFDLIYGEEAKEIMLHYLIEIYNEKKQGVRFLNEKEDKIYILKTPEDVWEYINKFCKK